jgi:type VI protein secretion system component VasF
LRPAGSLHTDPVPVETRPTGSILTWIIGAIVLIVLAYFLLQMLF